jgi:undecaprenyl-diphosphatase
MKAKGMATLIEIIILAIIQGITEWLPVSSSGHLALVQEFFQMGDMLVYDVMFHVGTSIVILIVFRKDFVKILKALARRDFQSEDGKLAIYIVIGTIPVAVVGVAFYGIIDALFQNATAVSIALLITGFILFTSERREDTKKLGVLDSLYIGIAQAVAIVPGISRSGATISTGLLRGVEKEKVFKYSFLLAAPAILGAGIYEIYKVRNTIVQGVDWAALFVGVVVSMVVGYIALKALLRIVMKRKFHYFAYYCWAVGLIVLLLLVVK